MNKKQLKQETKLFKTCISNPPKKVYSDRPLILYHGTSLSNLEKIKKQGIKPRNKRKSNWIDIGISRPNLVYLTNCYACYYASASLKKEKDKGVIIKLKIDPKKIKLYLDEEFIYHLLNYNKVSSKQEAMDLYNTIDPKNTNTFINKNLKRIPIWQDSLNFMGTVSCDYIPIENIIGYSILDRPGLYYCDPTINPLNYKIMSGVYINYLKKLKYKKL